MIEPNTLGGLIGGALIGLAAVLLLALNGRIAGTFKRGGRSATRNRRRDFRRRWGPGRFLSRTGIGGSGLRITACDSICGGDACGAMVGVAPRSAVAGC
jgi:hypothetical protein